jgi:hypothetical protein
MTDKFSFSRDRLNFFMDKSSVLRTNAAFSGMIKLLQG